MKKKARVLSALILATMLLLTMFLVLNLNFEKPVIQVQSCSNYPVLEPGNLVFVEDRDFDELKEGDTVIYKVGGREMVIAHQVVEIEDNYLATKGVNNPDQFGFEENVEKNQIRGAKIFSIPLPHEAECEER